MKKVRGTIIGLLITTLIMAPLANAQPTGQLKPDDSTLYMSITMDCLAVKFKLTKVHEDDGLVRVTAGQAYDQIGNKLMTRLNSKIAEQKLGGGPLINAAADFEDNLNEFRESYRVYEVAMNNLLKADCQSQQQTFYSALQDVRTKREEVHKTTLELQSSMKAYYEAFQEFKKDHLEKLNQEASNG